MVKSSYRKILVLLLIVVFMFILVQNERQGHINYEISILKDNILDIFKKKDKEVTAFAVNSNTVDNQSENVYLANQQQQEAPSISLKEQDFAILFNSKESYSVQLKDNILVTLGYMSIKNPSVYDVSDGMPSLNNHKRIVVAIFNYEVFSNSQIEEIITFVNNGGKSFFACSITGANVFEGLYRYLGVVKYTSDEPTYLIKVNHSGFMAGISEGQVYGEVGSYSLLESSLLVELDKKSLLFLSSGNEGKWKPLAWQRHFGNGDFYVYGGFNLAYKNNRGLLCAMLSRMCDDFIYPIMNSMVLYIDDYPAPAPGGYNEALWKQYKKSTRDFLTDIWWRDIKKIAEDNKLKLTTLVVETYNDRVTGPFKSEDNSEMWRKKIAEIIKMGGEVGYHGYNHLPLCEVGFMYDNLGYKNWENKEDMIAATTELKKFCYKIAPNNVFATYVPPSNFLSPMGREVIVEAFPDLKVIASIYLNGSDNNPYIQEFEEGKDEILEFPRISSGFLMEASTQWEIYNLSNLHGLFSHFVHPDDVLDVLRSYPYHWEDMEFQFRGFIEKYVNSFPDIRRMTASEGGLAMQKYIKTRVRFETVGNTIYAETDSFLEGQFFYLRTDNEVIDAINCKFNRMSDGYYLVEALDKNFSINFSGEDLK